MTTEEILVEAARIVEREWVQTYPGMCAYGAIRHAGNGDWLLYKPAFQAVCQELGVGTPGALGKWNDAKGRTREEVVSVILNAKRWL